MSYRQVIAMAVLLAVGLPLASSHAKLPKPRSKTIVPGKSIGGVKVGAKFRTVQAKWGRNRTCKGKLVFSCEYRGSGAQGGAVVVQLGGTIKSVQIRAGSGGAGGPVFSGPLMRLTTTSGIGLGSTEAQVRAAYPAAQNTAADVLALGSPGSVRTFFQLGNGVVEEISIAR